MSGTHDDEGRPTPGGGRPQAPGPVRDLAHARRSARMARDWASADRLKAEIEAAGWRVVDRGADFALLPAVPPDLEQDGALLHGGSASVASRLDGPASGRLSLIVILAAADAPAGADLPAPAPGLEVTVVVAGARPLSMPPGIELVRLLPEATVGELVAAGLRRIGGEVAILAFGPEAARLAADPAIRSALLEPLADPTLAVTGTAGARTDDLRDLVPVDAGEADLLVAGLLAFRRADVAEALPVDERIVSAHRVAEWWSLRLREGSAQEGRAAPRRAVVVGGGDAARAALVGDAITDRSARRDFYRLRDRFGHRDDLLSGPDAAAGAVGTASGSPR